MDCMATYIIILITLLIIAFNRFGFNKFNSNYLREQFVVSPPLHRELLNTIRPDPRMHKYAPTYYKDPSVMTEKQQLKFLNSAKFMKMTVQDYINWLNMSIKYGRSLNDHNKQVYAKYNAGIRLTLNDVPAEYDNPIPPENAQQYYDSYINTINPIYGH